MKPGDFVVSDFYHGIKPISDFYHGIKANQAESDKERCIWCYSDVGDFYKGIKEKGKNTDLHIEVMGMMEVMMMTMMMTMEVMMMIIMIIIMNCGMGTKG